MERFSICTSVHPSVHLYVCPFICPYVCPYYRMSAHLNIPPRLAQGTASLASDLASQAQPARPQAQTARPSQPDLSQWDLRLRQPGIDLSQSALRFKQPASHNQPVRPNQPSLSPSKWGLRPLPAGSESWQWRHRPHSTKLCPLSGPLPCFPPRKQKKKSSQTKLSRAREPLTNWYLWAADFFFVHFWLQNATLKEILSVRPWCWTRNNVGLRLPQQFSYFL